jgi:two-component system phosphate regulon sensor histidine kinase PhoR
MRIGDKIAHMARDAGFLDGLRRVVWAAAAGLIVGGAVIVWYGTRGFWFIALAIAAAAVVASVAANRVTYRKRSLDGSKDNGLPVLGPLARELLEQLPDPLMLVDADGRVISANRAMREVVGVDVERKHVSALLRTPTVLEALSRSAASGEAGSVEYIVRVPVERHYQVFTARIGTNPAVAMLLMHDLTAVKRTEQMRVDFIANASHELRTPLAAVAGFIETLKGPARDDRAAREKFLGIMSVEAERMRRLIEDLLSLTRIELNEHVPPRGEVELEAVVREATAALAPLTKSDNITIFVDAAEGLPHVTGERDELVQLFQNLIHNAIKYGRNNGHVTITLRQTSATARRSQEPMVTAAVKDDGEGIPSEAIPRLTERFYRVDVKRSRERGGTGLGLAIVKHIVNRHGGRMQIESRVGEGSTFTITLPAIRKPADAPVTELL